MNRNFNRWVGMRSLGVLTCAGLAVSGWAMDQPQTTAQGQANKTRANQDSSYQTQGKPNSGGQGSDDQPAQSSSNRSKGSTDQRVVDLLNTVNQAEIDEGKWMQDHAQSQSVKDYAKMLVSDHQSAAETLKEVSNKANLTPATDAAVQQESMQLKSRLSTTPGTAGDREYLRAEVQDHAKVVRQLRHMEAHVTDPGLKTYVGQTLPALQTHLRQAHQLMRGGAATGTPAGEAMHRHAVPPPTR